jgi:hypothetical protein
MQITRMPGFSADASLYRRRPNYPADHPSSTRSQSATGRIQPALINSGICSCGQYTYNNDDTYCCCWPHLLSWNLAGYASCCNQRTGACGPPELLGVTYRGGF